jgi:hypothetical protein
VTTTTKRKPTAPRKTVKAGVNGHTNGAPVPPATDEELRAPERFIADPEESVPEEVAPPAPPPVLHPYGDVPVFTFQPNIVKPGDSMDPIIVPHISTVNGDVEFFWEMDELDPMHQSFRYMKRANIPRDIQRRVVRLPEGEMARFLNGWFMGVLVPQGVGPPGES